MIKLITLDIDGTLDNDERTISPRTQAALRAVEEQGVRLMLCSGRQAPGLRHEAELLKLASYHGLLASYNGGRIQEATTGEILFDSSIENGLARRFLRHLEQWPELSPIVDDGESIYTTDENRHKVHDESRNNNLKIKIVPDIAAAVTWRPVKILTAAPEGILVPHLADIREGFEDELSFVQSAPWFYEATVKGVAKESAIRQVMEKFDIKAEEIMAFGDAQNDMGMLELAGYAVAMGNAIPELKQMADEVTLSHNSDGIAATLERYFQLDEKQLKS